MPLMPRAPSSPTTGMQAPKHITIITPIDTEQGNKTLTGYEGEH